MSDAGRSNWTEIFSRWHVLHRDTRIAGFVSILSWIGISMAWGWLAWRYWRGRKTD